MERESSEKITDALIVFELVESKLSPEDKLALEKFDNSCDVFENENGRELRDKEWFKLIESIPGAQEALIKYTQWTDYFERIISLDKH